MKSNVFLPFRILCILLILINCSGCSGSGLSAEHQNIERLLPIQTLGIDTNGTGVELSVSSGINTEKDPPLVLRTTAFSMEMAIKRLQEYSPRDELYYAHVQYILLGQSAAETDLKDILRWVERSPDMRMGTAIFVIKGSASQAIIDADSEASDITEQLASLERDARIFGRHIYSLREISTSLAEEGCALCLAIDSVPSDDTVFTMDSSEISLIPIGYAVLKDDTLVSFLSREESLGADLLSGDVTGSRVIVEGNTLELVSDDITIHGQWGEDGMLDGLLLQGTLQAGILEQDTGSEKNPDKLDMFLSNAANQWLSSVIMQAQTIECDFLGIHNAINREHPSNIPLEEWIGIFSSLPVSIDIKGEVDRSYDLVQ